MYCASLLFIFNRNRYLENNEKLDFSKKLDTIYYRICKQTEIRSIFPVFMKSFVDAYILMVTGDMTVDTIKHKVEEKNGIPFDEINLISNGKRLENELRLIDYHIYPFSTMHIVRKRLM